MVFFWRVLVGMWDGTNCQKSWASKETVFILRVVYFFVLSIFYSCWTRINFDYWFLLVFLIERMLRNFIQAVPAISSRAFSAAAANSGLSFGKKFSCSIS